MRIPLFSSKRLGIDLGTSNSLVWASGRGIVLAEPSVVAVDEVSGAVVAVGRRAAEMLGKTAVDLVAKKPLKEGVIADYVASEAMLKYFLERSLGYSRFSGPEVMICVPYGITQVERRAVLEEVYRKEKELEKVSSNLDYEIEKQKKLIEKLDMYLLSMVRNSSFHMILSLLVI